MRSPVSRMFLHLLFLGLLASVSATARPQDHTLEPEPIATPPSYANATAPISPFNTRSLYARQFFCRPGTHACTSAEQGCCPDTSYCVTISGRMGCCPNGKVCTRPPVGPPPPPTCDKSGYFVCPGQDFCCPFGAICSSNSRSCEGGSPPPPDSPPPLDSPPPPPPDSPPPPQTTYDTWTNTDTYGAGTASTSSYGNPTANIETTSAYTSPPRQTSSTKTKTSSNFNGGGNDSLRVLTTPTSSVLGGNQPLLSSAQNTVPGYSVAGCMFLMAIVGLL